MVGLNTNYILIAMKIPVRNNLQEKMVYFISQLDVPMHYVWKCRLDRNDGKGMTSER